jgi:hypothetical protein
MIAVATSADQYWHIHRSDCRKTLIYPHTSSPMLSIFDIILNTLMLSATESRDFVKLLLLHILKFPFCFLAGNNTKRQPHAGPASCHFHLPVLYHHLDNSECIETTWVCGGTFLLSDTLIYIRQKCKIISLELAVIRRHGVWSPKQYLTRQPTNQTNEFLALKFLQCLGYDESI